MKFENIVPNEPVSAISYDNLRILLENLESEMEKIVKMAEEMEKNDSPQLISSIQPSGVIQSVKLVVKLMGTLETQEISEAIQGFKDACGKFSPNSCEATWECKSISDLIKLNCEKIRVAVQGLIEMYCQAFRVDFQLKIHNEDRTCRF